MSNTQIACPDREELRNYLLGKLPERQSDDCEKHIASCHPCEETLRYFNVSGTMHELTRRAVEGLDSIQIDQNQSDVVAGLVHDMQQWTKDSLPSEPISELADRATEVQHFFEPSDEVQHLGVVGKYEIVTLLGAGSSGVVYRAIDTSLGREVAIKFLRPSLGVAARQRFMAEAQAAALITHPNIVPIYEVGILGKLAFIAMQWLAGETLDERGDV